MNRSIFALALMAAFAGAAASAQADGMGGAVPMAAEATAQLSPASTVTPQPSQGNAALQDYRANINPNSNIPTTGIYDQGDRFEGPTGRPLPGWGSANGEGAGDN